MPYPLPHNLPLLPSSVAMWGALIEVLAEVLISPALWPQAVLLLPVHGVGNGQPLPVQVRVHCPAALCAFVCPAALVGRRSESAGLGAPISHKV